MFVLPPLPYDYKALEPYIDAKTMEIHYTKHHQAYIDNLNKALKDFPEYQKWTLEKLVTDYDQLPKEIATTVRNNAGGHYNHSFFWPLMKKSGGGAPKGTLAKAINEKFGSFENFKQEFNEAAKKVFGSGWAWLVVDKNGKLLGISSPNQDCPLTLGYTPILGLDVWEHAYYLKYQNKRPDYISAWWSVVNWDKAQEHYDAAVKK